MFEGKSIRKSAAACAVSATTSARWRQRLMKCTGEERAKVLGAIIGACSSAPALTGISEDASAANMSWCKELLPVILSWFL
jgi:hypothetical protein